MEPKIFLDRVIAGRFQITDIIGEGGMGTVYLAKHTTLPRRFAIKILKEELAQDPVFVERFRREAIAASRVVHPNVVYITDFGKLPDGYFYMVMEYLEGESLEDALDRQGRLPLSRALHILIQLTDALGHAHTMGVVHRDLKLENIMLCALRGHKDVVKLVDFGIAVILDPEEKSSQKATIKGQVFGTPEYMSPEQAMDRPQDGRSDIYSLGILAFELVTGEPPFLGEPTQILHAHLQRQPPTPSSQLPGQRIPRAFDACVLRCLAKLPKNRYRIAAELRRDLLKLRGLLAGLDDTNTAELDTECHPAFQPSNQNPWRSIDTLKESVLSAIEMPYPGQQLVPPSAHPEDHAETAATLSTNELRTRYHQALKELAFSLGESAIRSEEMTNLLNRLLQLEEEEAALAAQIALMEQNFERIRFETSDKETMLRHAILDLTLEKTSLLDGRPNPPDDIKTQVQDLGFQIEQLQKRLDEILTDKSSRIQSLNKEIEEFRQTKSQRSWEAAEVYIQLHNVVARVREKASGEKLNQLYQKADHLRERLETTRRNVTGITDHGTQPPPPSKPAPPQE
jgi:serine/threonine protein kinase